MKEKFVYESFANFLNYKLLMETATAEDLARLNEADTDPSPWDFKFDSGKFKKSDVTADQLKKLDDDFKKRIVPVLNNQNYIGQKLSVNISSASSKVPINPSGSVAKELKDLGYKPDNTGLCKARGNTVVEIIKGILYKSFGGDMEESKFFKEMEKKVTFVNKPNPNIGPEYSKEKGDAPEDQKYKDNQYISATLDVTGEKIPSDLLIKCNMNQSFKGGKADISNGYAGYDKKVYLSAKSGQIMEITFDPFTVPDSILFSYSGASPKLSPFMGAVGAKFIKAKWSKAEEDRLNAEVAKTDGMIPAKKELIGGTNYLVIDYKDHLNNVINKGGVLVKSIESKLKTLGLKPIKDICPKFFDANGKIEVYATKDKSELTVAQDLVNDPSAITYQLLKSGALAQSPKIDNEALKIKVTKNITRDEITLVAFSPITGTSFSLKTTCG